MKRHRIYNSYDFADGKEFSSVEFQFMSNLTGNS